MRHFIVLLILGGAISWSGAVHAGALPERSDIEAVCGKFGTLNKEFCGLVLQVYDAVDDLDSRVGDLEKAVEAIPQHPHIPFGYEATKQEISQLRADMDAQFGKVDGAISAIPQHPHTPFGYDATQREIAALKAAIEELKAAQPKP